GDDRTRALRQLDMRDVDTVADLQASQVSRDGFRNVAGQSVQFDSVANDVQDAACLDARGLLFVDEVNRYFDHDVGVARNAEEVDMHREVADRIQLVVLWQDLDLLAVDVDHGDGRLEAA